MSPQPWPFLLAITLALALPVASDADTPTTTATSTAVTTPTPATSPTSTYQGRPCATGTLINDFVILVDREPQPSCVLPFEPEAPEQLYGLGSVPLNLRLRGIERSTEGGFEVVSVVYDALRTGPPTSPGPFLEQSAVTISYRREGLVKPFPVHLFIRSQASTAPFLPAPGLLLEPGAAVQIGQWFTDSGLYRLTVESRGPGVSLDIQELSQLLRPMTAEEILRAAPAPPATGNGAGGSTRSMPLAVATGLFLASSALWWVLGWRLRRHRHRGRRAAS